MKQAMRKQYFKFILSSLKGKKNMSQQTQKPQFKVK